MNRRKRAEQMLLRKYTDGEHSPWSAGYLNYRRLRICETLADADLMERFEQGLQLPNGFGYALDERCVEYPWLISRMADAVERILDAGSTLNHEFLLDHPVWKRKNLHIVSLSPEPACHWMRGISYLYEDLRFLPIADETYDVVVCASTLEHVGFDNRRFTGRDEPDEFRPRDFLLAMKEMSRVLKAGGRLLLTVPFGRSREMETQRVFDLPLLEQAVAAFPADLSRFTYYGYSSNGWQVVDASSCRDAEYVDWIMLPAEKRPANFPVQPDGACAARAVACVELFKSRSSLDTPAELGT